MLDRSFTRTRRYARRVPASGPPEPLVLTGDRVRLRPVCEGDVPTLAALLAEPQIALWWHGYDEARVREDFLHTPDDVVALAVEHETEVVGAAQFAEEPEPDYRHASIDLFIASQLHGRGLGSEVLRLLARHLFEDRGHHRLVIDPALANVHAIRAYERVGFRRVGVMRCYERGADGDFHDGLLMELLAGELLVEN